MTTRFLLTCISSYFFDGEKTLDDLHEFIVEDAIELYKNGVTVSLTYISILFPLPPQYWKTLRLPSMECASL